MRGAPRYTAGAPVAWTRSLDLDMWTVTPIPAPGDLIEGRYEIVAEVGRGGFGVVFEARDRDKPGQVVALKLLRPDVMVIDSVLERFEREASLIAQLNHPGVVRFLDSGLHVGARAEGQSADPVGLPFAVMELLKGRDLSKILKESGPQGAALTLYVITQALDALAEAHRRGIVHRDLKPSNIFVCDDRRLDDKPTIKVLDFGIAKAFKGDWDSAMFARLTDTGFVAGTPEYMAPEQASDRPDITPALDVYAMGCIAFKMLTGREPIRGNNAMDTVVKQVSAPIPDLPAPYNQTFFGAAIRRALAKKPEDRFRDAAHFAQALRNHRMSIPMSVPLDLKVPLPFFEVRQDSSPHSALTTVVATPRPPKDDPEA